MARGIAILGDGAGTAQAALTLADLGHEVKIITSSPSLSLDDGDCGSIADYRERISVWPLLLRAATHPLVTIHTNSEITAISGKRGKFTVKTVKNPRYVREDLCTGCSRCAEACSVQIPCILDGRKSIYSAIHPSVPNRKSVPIAFSIEKTGIAPCRAACPVGINVQGYISLLSKGKVDEALSQINEAAPLAGILGRVCTHPCQDNCKRAEVDSPVYIPALHRFAADNAPSGINYKREAPAKSRRERIAIVGSGPAGLAAAWELARRGYTPTIFESHAVVGGMVATGIPRFRLPHEVREREVEAIKALGVDILTGVTVGRDVTISDLRERGYRAFFLAIGAHQNRGLNIPGEELEGVVDAVSLLFALNLKVGATVGSNIVVIGGGNSAVDSARTAKRKSKGEVRILYRRTAEEMTAVADEVEEALKEGVSIEYLTQPVEILGDGMKVTGIRCQRMKLGEMDADGRRKPEPIPGSEFVIEADHVVMAIGQRPNSSVLNIKGLDIDSDEATIQADPLTLETSIPGIFSGGDCVTGPNNVVDAVADGLRAAESIDRYLRGRDLKKGRTLEKPKPVDIDVNTREASYHKRARMPAIPPNKRMGRYEEIALGLPVDVGQREAERCLNCALCSECLQCEQVCELGAVLHQDKMETIDIGADVVIDFAPSTHSSYDHPGVYTVEADEDRSLEDELASASAMALDVAAELRPRDEAYPAGKYTGISGEALLERKTDAVELIPSDRARIGVVLCRCSGSISSIIDFNQVTNEVLQLPGVCNVQEISQACSEEGAKRIGGQVAEWKLDKVVLAACRCCGLEQICFSCTDRRVMCQQYLKDSLVSQYGEKVDFVNIREQCSRVHEDDPAGATAKAVDIISSGVARAKQSAPSVCEEYQVSGSALILGAGSSGLTAAKYLADLGYPVTVVSGPTPKAAKPKRSPEYTEHRENLSKQLNERGVAVRAWPHDLELEGSPGNYEAVLKDNSHTSRIPAGAIIVDLGNLEGEIPLETSVISRERRLGRILTPINGPESLTNGHTNGLREVAIRETAGIFVVSLDSEEPPEEHSLKGAAAAARASAYLARGSTRPRGTAVTINSKLCRGCGNCAGICSFIELKERESGIPYAHIDQTLCLGCGACIAQCPTGAISQPQQSDEQIGSSLEGLLGSANRVVVAK